MHADEVADHDEIADDETAKAIIMALLGGDTVGAQAVWEMAERPTAVFASLTGIAVGAIIALAQLTNQDPREMFSAFEAGPQ